MNIVQTDDFLVEEVGIKEEWVYDIEVEENHNFFANNVCVHNSAYVHVEDVIKKFQPKDPVKFLDEFGSKGIEPCLNKCFKELYKISNSYVPKMAMKREAIADRGIWTAKKRYILNVHNNEGVQYAEPKIKITGIEAIKSSTPKVCRAAMKNLFKSIMTKTEEEVRAEIADFKTKFFGMSPEEIAFPKSIRSLKEYASTSNIYVKGSEGTCPIHCRAALLYNWKVKTMGLEKTCKLIRPGDKVKMLFLKKPNELRNENVVAFPDSLPSQLGLHKSIDYETQFQKTFIEPVSHIFEAIKWKIEDTGSLESFFV